MTNDTDVLVVGAGIAGLAHAIAAHERGLRVTVIDRDHRAVGASVRNFGHACITAQTGELYELAQVARTKWLHYGRAAGMFVRETGALAVARTAAEAAVLDELSGTRETGQVRVLTASEVRRHLGDAADPTIIGGALLRDDLRVDPREAVGALAAWLAEQDDVVFRWGTTFLGAEGGVARTSHGEIRAERVIVCVGHDLDYVFPELAAAAEVERCALQMALAEPPEGLRLGPAVLTGTSMLRYPAFSETTAADALRDEMAASHPDLIDIGANVMFTQRPDGSLIVGDSHRYGATMDPFQTEATSSLLLDEIGRVLGTPLRIRQRWQGVYASSGRQPYLIGEPVPGVTAVSITSGVGMTISLGVAQKTLSAFD
jgi:D-hydroxyproline dehydrogenase subunit beta